MHHYEEAIKDFNEVLQLNSKETAALLARGEAHEALTRYDAALSDYKSALKLEETTEIYCRCAELAFRMGSLQKALHHVKEGLKKQTKSSSMGAQALYGDILLSLGMKEEAEKTFKKAQNESSDQDLAFYWRARLGFHLNDFESAEIDARAGIKCNEKNVDLHVFLGDLYAKQERFQKAVKYYNNAILLNPPNADLLRKKRDEYQKLEKQAIDTKKEKPAKEKSLIDKKILKEEEPKNFADAINFYSKKFSQSSSKEKINTVDLKAAQDLFQDGLMLVALSQFEKAIKKFDQSIEANPENAEAYLERALCKEQLNDLVGALKDYEFVIKPEFKTLLTNKKIYDKVIQSFERLNRKLASSEKKSVKEETPVHQSVVQEKPVSSAENRKLKLISALKTLEQAQKEKMLKLGEIQSKYKELEFDALEFESVEFFISRGRFYFDAACAEQNKTRRLAHYANAKQDFEEALKIDSFAPDAAELIEEIEKQLQQVNPLSSTLTSQVMPSTSLSLTDLSPEDLKKLEEYKKEYAQTINK